jgi:hypothetical protein
MEQVIWDGSRFLVPPSILALWEDRYPNIRRAAILSEIDKAAMWAEENWARKKRKNPKLFLTRWLDKPFLPKSVRFERSLAASNAAVLDELEARRPQVVNDVPF